MLVDGVFRKDTACNVGHHEGLLLSVGLNEDIVNTVYQTEKIYCSWAA
jgi:hypothetical protein